MPGTGRAGGFPAETPGDAYLSGVPADGGDKKALQTGAQQQQQQQQNLLLTPASLQLAQLQAQLTLHRLKLAQGGNAAAAASVLNQVLSNVAMSQPLFNQLRNSGVVGNPQAGFPAGVLGFPSSGVGGFGQNQNVRLNAQGGGTTAAQQGPDFGKKPGMAYPSDTDRRLQYGPGGAATAASVAPGDGQYAGIVTQANSVNNAGFKQDFFGRDAAGQQGGFGAAEQGVYNAALQTEPWKVPSGLAKMGTASDSAPCWTPSGHPAQSRTELYNPEEPTPEPPKFNPKPVFGGYQPPPAGEDAQGSGTRTLQPYQVNDYNALTPGQLPHQCSICDKKVYNLKDWDQHVKGKLHLQNRMLYVHEGSAAVPAAAAAAVYFPADGSLSAGTATSMIFSAAGQDVSSGAGASYLPAAAMKTFTAPATGFTSHLPESKPFPPRKASGGRVVHICNLPEGSCTENDVINLGLPFGKVTNYILMRSTHQAFLEMAYMEAAHAMVQYYQLTPAMINNQKLLIRMSKRYKELQLKKPGKDVQSIIHDITSQRERDEMQELEHYIPERARSRSPISRSLSPHSHSPSFTSCSSAHSPQGAPCRLQERGSNGLGPLRGSWDWSPHFRRGEDEKERRNGGVADDERGVERRKAYQKPMEYMGTRSGDERGGGGGGGDDGMRGGRDRYPRGSPQGVSFNSYRKLDDEFYLKEQVYKSEKSSRTSYQRHDSKPKRRDGSDYHSRSRHAEVEMADDPHRKTPEDKRQASPGRGRSKKTSRRYNFPVEKHERDSATDSTDRQSKEESASPQRSSKSKEALEDTKDDEKETESAENTDEECWYPKNMEELVTVDEVGGEDDSIIEPDLPELEEFASCPKELAEGAAAEEGTLAPTSSVEVKESSREKSDVEEPRGGAGERQEPPATEKVANGSAGANEDDQKAAAEEPTSKLSGFPGEEFKAALEDACPEEKVTNSGSVEEAPENHISASEDSKSCDTEVLMQTPAPVTQQKDGKTEMETPSSSRDQDKAVHERSIPLGVEFVVPRTGFYCNLCDLFYTSEEAAKTTHCRSTVHYRNLQKYLSQLAQESLMGALAEPSTTH